jgi:hypothetical protein
MYWLTVLSYCSPLLPEVLVSSGSLGSALKAPQLVLWYVIDLTADSLPMKALLPSVSWSLTGYTLPALPVLTVLGLLTGAR